MGVKAQYRRIIRDIMEEHDICPSHQPGHVVRNDAGFAEVVQHTDFYVGKGGDAQRGAREHYRYDRYLEVLQDLTASGSREAHVDIGCGAGLFSWAFLDWANEEGIEPDRVDLYGLDHSPAMLCLAQEVRSRLTPTVPDYPKLHYCHDPEALLQELTENHHESTDYTITLGHVLVQAHATCDINKFTQVIVHISELMDGQSNCALVAVDARGRPMEFAKGWDLLLNSLERVGIRNQQCQVQTTHINDGESAKFAWLYPA